MPQYMVFVEPVFFPSEKYQFTAWDSNKTKEGCNVAILYLKRKIARKYHQQGICTMIFIHWNNSLFLLKAPIHGTRFSAIMQYSGKMVESDMIQELKLSERLNLLDKEINSWTWYDPLVTQKHMAMGHIYMQKITKTVRFAQSLKPQIQEHKLFFIWN